MISLREFCVLIFAALFLAMYTEALDSIRDLEVVENYFINSFVRWSFFSYFQNSPVPPTLCDLPKETKLAICNILVQRDHYVTELIPSIYFNKAAAFYKTADCEEKPISFRSKKEYNINMVTHRIFPCYGRHDPIRTDWDKDDYFDAFYISEGSEPDSVFVYDRTKTVFHVFTFPRTSIHEYSLLEYVKNVNIANLTPINVTEEDVKHELKLRKIVTFNVDYRENEINFIREKNYGVMESNAICNLEKEAKIRLCKKMFNRDTYRNDNFIVDDTAMLTYSIICEYKRISFSYVPIFNTFRWHHKMLPCYGTSPSALASGGTDEYVLIFYLAEGIRKNSVIIYRENDDMITHSIVEFAENVFLGLCTVTLNITMDIRTMEEIFIETFVQNENKLNSLCDLPKEKKLAICEAVLSQSRSESNSDYDEYFNKAAAFFLSPDCIEISLIFTYDHKNLNDKLNGKPPIQKLFPCYARSNPMRTNWDIDDNFDKIYLSGGHEDDSVFVYKQYKEIIADDYRPSYLIQDAGIENLLPLFIREDEVNEELKQLEIISCYPIRLNIETLFLREIIRNNVQISNAICDFENEKKLTLCKRVMNTCYQNSDNWVLNEEAFRLTKCEEESIQFQFELDYNDPRIKIKMFPCHGKILDPLKETVSENKKISDSEKESDCDRENLHLQISTDEENPSEQHESENEIQTGSNTDLNIECDSEQNMTISDSEKESDCDCENLHLQISTDDENPSELHHLNSSSGSSSSSGHEEDNLQFYLSGSYLPNSVLVYQKSSRKDDMRAIYYLVENLKLTELELSIIPEPQTQE